ncbi:WXG100-like domain-containing protein [Nonomuraea recticatena]
MAGSSHGDVNTDTPDGQASSGEGGPPRTDVQPAWETEILPDWVQYVVMPLLASGEVWPKVSESGLWAMARSYEKAANALTSAANPTKQAVGTTVSGWDSIATPAFLSRVGDLFGEEAGLGAVAKRLNGDWQQIDSFARETQYSKISINVAFWIAVIAASIALIAAFFSAGTTAWLVGPYAAAARATIGRILQLLAVNAGRGMIAGGAAQIPVLSGVVQGVSRLAASPLAREMFEEMGEEIFIDAWSQYEQMRQGTRGEWDWKKTAASAVGAGTGAAAGMASAHRVSRFTERLPGIAQLNRLAGDSPGLGNALLRFPGRAMNTGLNNAVVSPFSSVLANGMVYGQWAMPTADAFIGAFVGGVGRTGTISPFNPDAAMALTHPASALASATAAAARSDAARAVDQAMATGHASPLVGNGSASSIVPLAGTVPTGTTPTGSPTSGAEGMAHGPGVPANSTGTTSVQSPSSSPSVPGPTQPQTQQPLPGVQNAGPSQGAQAAQGAGQQVGGLSPDPAAQAPGAGNTPTSASQAAQQDASLPTSTASPGIGGTQVEAGNTSQAAAHVQPGASASVPATLSTAMAQNALAEAQRLAFPHGIPLQNGGLFVNGATGQSLTLSPQMLGRTQERLARQAANGATPQRLRAEAAAALGAEAALASGTSRVHGAMEALDRLANADPGSAPEAAAHARDWYSGDDPAEVDRIANRLAARAPTPDAVLRARFYDVAAEEIADLVADLSGHTSQVAANGTNVNGFPRTVTARQIRHSLFEPQRRRPAHLSPTTTAEVHAATMAELDLSDFGGEVVSLTWSHHSALMVVETRTDGTLHYRVRIGGVGDGNVAESDIRTGTETDPIIMKIAPGAPTASLYRAVVHEISHGAQTRAAAAANAAQGLLRRWLSSARTAEGRDECFTARLNEFRLLSRKWRTSSSMDDRQRWAHEIDQLITNLVECGHAPPVPPWASGQSAAPAPVNTGTPLSALTSYVSRTVDSLSMTEDGLRVRIAAHRDNAAAAEKEIDKAKDEKGKGAQRARQERHLRIQEAYQEALEYATQARQAYQELLAELNQDVPADPNRFEELAVEAKDWLGHFQQALGYALPSLAALPDFVAADRLPHLGKLTETINGLLGEPEREVDASFTPESLERLVRAEFSRIVSKDGALIRVGRDRSGELLIKLSVSDLVEVLDSAKFASEIINGVLPLGGRTVGATANRSGGTTIGVKLSPWVSMLPPSAAKEVLKHTDLKAAATKGLSASVTGKANRYVVGGGVGDNRGESALVDGHAAWTVQVRMSLNQGWSRPVTVAHGNHGDAASLRAYVSYAYMESPPLGEARLPEAERRRTKFPDHMVNGLTGLIKLADDTATALGEEYFPPGGVAQQQLYNAFIEDLYSRISQAVDSPGECSASSTSTAGPVFTWRSGPSRGWRRREGSARLADSTGKNGFASVSAARWAASPPGGPSARACRHRSAPRASMACRGPANTP